MGNTVTEPRFGSLRRLISKLKVYPLLFHIDVSYVAFVLLSYGEHFLVRAGVAHESFFKVPFLSSFESCLLYTSDAADE